MIGNEETFAGPRCVSYHACTGVSLTTSDDLVKCDTSYSTGLHDNYRGVRISRRIFSTGHMHSTLNETGFATDQLVSTTTNMVGNYMKNRVGGR